MATLPGRIDEPALTGLVERSGGNPLYLEELVTDARATAVALLEQKGFAPAAVEAWARLRTSN